MRMNKFLWERRRRPTLRDVTGTLVIFVVLDYDVGNAMVSGILPLVQNYGSPW